jgi:hypothetical protein
MKIPTVQQWNLTVEHQLPADILLRASYEGSESYHLGGGVEGNPATYIPGQSTFANVQSRRPMGQYFTNLSILKSLGTASFNSLTLSAQKQMTHGLTFLAGFRWAKSLDELSNTNYQGDDYPSVYVWQNRGLSDFDIPKRFVASYVYQLPTLKSLGFVGRNVLGGWGTSGILTAETNFPFTVLSGVNYSYNGISLDRADIVGNPYLPGNRPESAKLQKWFNTAAFAYNAAGTIGDSARNFLRGPNSVDFDFALTKSFPIKKGPWAESQRIDFRAEFFNLLNHPNFANPTATESSTVNGRILSAADPRIIQFALKFVF